MAIGGFFECCMYRITVPGWLKREKNEQFWPLTVSGFRGVVVVIRLVNIHKLLIIIIHDE